MSEHTEVIVDELPDCDFCKEAGHPRPAHYDGRVRGVSSWANMCHRHFEAYGVAYREGLGLGVGQRLVLRSEQPRRLPDEAREALGWIESEVDS